MIKKLPANVVYLIYCGATSLFFTLVFTVNMIYQVDTVKLNPLQLILVGTVLEITCFIFEIPTGIVADLYSRRASVIVGLVLTGLGFLVEGLVPLFMPILLAQVLWGMGATFTSGADSAWIADETGGDNLDHIFFKGAQAGQFAALISTFAAIGLATIKLNLPIVLGGGLFILLAFFLIVFMPEVNYTPAAKEERSSWSSTFSTARKGLSLVKSHHIIIIIMAITAFEGLYSEGFDRLWTVRFLKDLTLPAIGHWDPIIWFSIINSVSMILCIVIVQVMETHLRNSGKLTMMWAMFFINAILLASILVFALAGNFTLALLSYWSCSVMRSANSPLYNLWINRNISESQVRATVLSMQGQINALGQIVGGPFIGLIATKLSVSTGIAVSGMLLSPALLLYLHVIFKRKNMSVNAKYVGISE